MKPKPNFSVASVVLSALISVPVLIPAEAATNDTRGAQSLIPSRPAMTNGVLKIRTLVELSFDAEPGHTYTLLTGPRASGPWSAVKNIDHTSVATNRPPVKFSIVQPADAPKQFWMLLIDDDGKVVINLEPPAPDPTASTNTVSDLPPIPGKL
jgi:hypothetical protein